MYIYHVFSMNFNKLFLLVFYIIILIMFIIYNNIDFKFIIIFL